MNFFSDEMRAFAASNCPTCRYYAWHGSAQGPHRLVDGTWHHPNCERVRAEREIVVGFEPTPRPPGSGATVASSILVTPGDIQDKIARVDLAWNLFIDDVYRAPMPPVSAEFKVQAAKAIGGWKKFVEDNPYWKSWASNAFDECDRWEAMLWNLREQLKGYGVAVTSPEFKKPNDPADSFGPFTGEDVKGMVNGVLLVGGLFAVAKIVTSLKNK